MRTMVLSPSWLTMVCLVTLLSLAQSLQPSDCRCRLGAEPRVIGGRSAPAGRFPWHVSLGHLGGTPALLDSPEYKKHGAAIRAGTSTNFMLRMHLCGGALLNERWVLTAAHCLKGNGTLHGAGHGGSLRQIFLDGRTPIRRIIRHPLYARVDPPVTTYDIALVELAANWTLTEQLQPACLPREAPALPSCSPLLAAGFGQLESRLIFLDRALTLHELGGVRANRLRELRMLCTTPDEPDCAAGEFICAEAPADRHSLSNGDSGSPLHATSGGRTAVVGVTSKVDGLYDERHRMQRQTHGFATFADVHRHLDFIRAHLGEDDFCLV